jgi:hypothetical protein
MKIKKEIKIKSSKILNLYPCKQALADSYRSAHP